MYHQPSKRTQFLRRTISYGATILAILALVTILVFVILGYQFNKKDGKIEQGGLVQFSSQPSGADITLDGTKFGARTTAKTTMTSGGHYVTMSRDGYQTWSKSVSVVPGAILWLNYARLIPKDLPVEKVANFTTVSSSQASPDQKWMMVATDPALPELELVDISQSTPVVTKLALPATLYTAPAAGKSQQFSVVEWDKDSRYVMVKHTAEGLDRPEWLIVDTQSLESSKNVTSLLNVAIDAAHFSPGSSQALYAQIAGDVRKIDLGAATLSRPLASNVEDFRLYRDNGVIFTTKLDPLTKERSVGYVLDSDTAPRILQTVTDDGTQPLRLAIGEYFSDTYVATQYGTTLTVRSGNLPKTAADMAAMQLVTTRQLSEPATRLSMITGSRFVVAESKNSYAVYDLELRKLTQTPYKGTDTSAVQLPLGWIDGYMPWSDRDGSLRLYEFDGANQHDILPVAHGQAVSLARSGAYLYTISPVNGAQQSLQRVRLILQ